MSINFEEYKETIEGVIDVMGRLQKIPRREYDELVNEFTMILEASRDPALRKELCIKMQRLLIEARVLAAKDYEP